ncbi:hypothetical protein TRFO_02599 [Tritrichomonas foetus]|uniref:Protein kinase domain-containing protein n=1 Tax=Tritrichomonas foetus TaxID=1144522 RepID=A0A1J4L6G8_9EUKA|nr:hypothetical protein TRFO_02599 [Tritrichomonas foetus]|eukprot:OHT17542.1 hypothetical protein TRFO_02599 [Tritrichomonas foetus]
MGCCTSSAAPVGNLPEDLQRAPEVINDSDDGNTNDSRYLQGKSPQKPKIAQPDDDQSDNDGQNFDRKQQTNNKDQINKNGTENSLQNQNQLKNKNSSRSLTKFANNSSNNNSARNISSTNNSTANINMNEEEDFDYEMCKDEFNLAGYEFEKIIGRGASAVVVQMSKDGVSYAVKVCDLRRAQINFLQANTHDPKDEAAILKRFEHNNVVKLFDFIEDTDNDQVFIVMELLSGGTIMECETVDDKRFAFSQVLSAVQYIHYQRIAHRDIKPANILRHADGTVRLVDFGISVFVPEGSCTIPVELVGTPSFAPPETITSDTYDPFAADIWSLGATLYYILFGHPPFVAENLFEQQRMITTEEPVFPEDADPDAVDLIKSMLVKMPENRIPTDDIWSHPFLNVLKSSMNSSILKVSSRIFESLSSSDTKNSVTRISRGSLRSSLRGSLRGSLKGSLKGSGKQSKAGSKLSRVSTKPVKPVKPVKPKKPKHKRHVTTSLKKETTEEQK